MNISLNWLREYFKDELPPADKLAETITFHAFEIEGIEKREAEKNDSTVKNGDVIFDIKVLPDRAHYALSHRGIAYELSAILDLPKKSFLPNIYGELNHKADQTRALSIEVEEEMLCPRYIGRIVENIKVTDSPQWLREKLESVGQRSINSIVDATNFVMLDIGQPLHAFDADKVKGDIVVRLAKAGEKIATLDGKEIILPAKTLVIADDESPLAIAGVKGGIRAQVGKDTKAIIIEAANFDPASVRKISGLVGIKNDSSKRFENGITPELAREAMGLISALVLKLSPDAKLGQPVDIYPKPAKQNRVKFSAQFICSKLGAALSEEEMVALLKRLGIEVSKEGTDLVALIPFDRLDITIPEDLVEEAGRLYGYEKILPADLPAVSGSAEINKNFYWQQKIRSILCSFGFSEVYTHTLVDTGIIEIQNPLASDKCALRTNLSKGIEKAIQLNVYNAPLIGIDPVRIFEMGNVFDKEGEHLSLAVAVGNIKGKGSKPNDSINEQIRQLREKLLAALSLDINTLCTIDDTGGLLLLNNKQIGIINNSDGIMEVDIDAIIAVLPEPKGWDIAIKPSDVKYTKISAYPFVLRDIAVFVPDTLTADHVSKLITEQAGALLVHSSLFDVFTKKFPDGNAKTSYAFSLVFQSAEKTLSDTEVNEVMKKITDAMQAKNWQVR